MQTENAKEPEIEEVAEVVDLNKSFFFKGENPDGAAVEVRLIRVKRVAALAPPADSVEKLKAIIPAAEAIVKLANELKFGAQKALSCIL